MQCFGPILPDKNAPAFHEPWEPRIVDLSGAVGATGKTRGNWRLSMESLPPADYLRMSYYERNIGYLVEIMIAGGLVTREEVDTGKAAKGSAKSVPALRPSDVAKQFAFDPPRPRPVENLPARFKSGDRVRARNIHPVGHTRLPRYARGRLGVIDREGGIQSFPDTAVYGREVNRQHVYSVRFAARELWGDQAGVRDSVYIDLWENYLEPA
jgi:nitrile hydratase